jgi:hypothetical protein
VKRTREGGKEGRVDFSGVGQFFPMRPWGERMAETMIKAYFFSLTQIFLLINEDKMN